jgi:hypothetical protein
MYAWPPISLVLPNTLKLSERTLEELAKMVVGDAHSISQS